MRYIALLRGVIFWSAPIMTFSRTRWSKIAGSAVYDGLTIRSANTALKPAAPAAAPAGAP